MQNALGVISDSCGYYFAYDSSIPNRLNENALLNYKEISLNNLLALLTKGTNVDFLFIRNQIVLKLKEVVKEAEYLSGNVIDVKTGKSVPYAAIELKNKFKGTVANFRGQFKFSLKDAVSSDTLLISSVGYEKKELMVSGINRSDSLVILLDLKEFELNPVEVKDSRYLRKTVGVQTGNLKGEMYLDTHGQQTALFFENSKRLEGKIEKVLFFLSPKGNTNAPFRVHIYELDSINKGPGKDLINRFLVVQPNVIRGWFEVDVFEFELDIPENGFFVALEGVFPNDPSQYLPRINTNPIKTKGLKKQKDIMLKVLSYGQRIGFRKTKVNQTWHCSPSGGWFQLEKQLFNVMIQGRLLVEPKGIVK